MYYIRQFDEIFEILRLVIPLDLSEKCISISSNVRPSVSGKMVYIEIKPSAMTTQLNSVTPGNDKVISKLIYDLVAIKFRM